MAADSYAVASRTAINAAVLRAGQDVLDADAVADHAAGSPLRTAGSSPQPSSLNLTHDVLALSPGTAVVIHGTSNHTLNGASGRVERFLSSTARYAIALEDGTLVSVCQVRKDWERERLPRFDSPESHVRNNPAWTSGIAIGAAISPPLPPPPTPPRANRASRS